MIATAGIRRFNRLIAFLAATSALIPLPAYAENLPTNGQVVAGSASVATSGGSMTVTQTSDRAVIDWTGFSVGRDNAVIFAQPRASSATLNRVRGDAASNIAGSITSNGAVYLVNPNGIFITDTGTVSAGGGFVASSLNITNEDFLAKKHDFTGKSASALVSNAGSITAGQGAYVALLGGAVSNSGTINVPLGRLGLGSGEQVALDINGGNFMQVAVPSALVTGGNTLVDNSGTIVVLGGRVQMKAAALRDAVRNLVNMSGTISADSATGQAGSIELSAGDSGRVNVTGALSASSVGGTGGSVTVEGRDIALGATSAINATGASGGGTVLVGGGYQGAGDLAQAQKLDMASGATIDVSATQDGKGGTAVLWSDIDDNSSRTDFKGTILARGAGAGDGGLVETSGYVADVAGGFVNAGSDHGAGGTWLIDPSDTTITQAVANSYRDTLNTGTNVINDVVGNMTWNSGVTLNKTLGGSATLTLRTTNNGGINLNGATIGSTSNALNLVLWTRYNNEASTGTVAIYASTISTNGGHVWMGGGNQSGTLWNGLTVGRDAAASLVFNTPGLHIAGSSILTQGGNLSMTGTNYYTGSDTSGTKAFGIWLDTGNTLSTGAGNINADGYAYGKYTDGAGIYIGQTSGSVDGAITISTTFGNVSLAGFATDQAGSGTGFRHGINIKSGNTNSPVAISTVSGSIALEGNANSTSSAFTTDSTGLQFQGANVGVMSRSGAITLTGRNSLENATTNIAGVRFAPTDATNSIRIGYDGTNAYTGDITINANSLLQLGTNYTNNNVISMRTTGKFVFQPIDTSFTFLRAESAALTFGSQWNFGTALTGFTWGKEGNNYDLNFVASGFKVNGQINLYGRNISFGSGLTSTADNLTGVNKGILVKARGIITSNNGLGFYTKNGDIVFWSNSGGSTTAGGIRIGDDNVFNSADQSTTQLIGGGSIIFGGGSNIGTRPTDAASSSSGFGVSFGSASTNTTTSTKIYSGGGAITMNGSTTSTVGAAQNGVSLNRSFIIDAGDGAVNITGYSGVDGQSIELGGWGDDSAAYSIRGGSITMTGTGNAFYGIGSVHQGGTITATGAGGITINGSTIKSGAGSYGVYSTGTGVNLISNAGPISISGTAVNGATGINFLGKILSTLGDISLNSGANLLNFRGTLGRDGSLVTSSSSSVTLTGDAVAFTSTAINTSGKLVVQPSSNSFSSAFTWPVSGLALSSDASGLTLGKATNTAGLTIASTTSIAGPISLYGGNIALNAGLTSTLSGAGILVKASGAITGGANLTFRTNNGNLVFWSNSAGSTGGGIVFGDGNSFNSANGVTNQTTGGGNIIFGGGNDTGSVPPGAASSSTTSGVAFGSYSSGNTTTSFYSGGGNISLNGASTLTSGNAFGTVINRIAIMNAGNGSISMTGAATNGHGIEVGAYNSVGTVVQVLAGGDINMSGTTTSNTNSGISIGQSGTRFQSTGGNISITGSSGTGGSGRGIYFDHSANVVMTNAGSISLTSNGSSSMRFAGGGKILSSSGAITLNSGTGTTDIQATIGRDGSLVNASSSDVTVTANNSTFTSTGINTTGVLTVQPFDASFTSAFTWPISGVTLGNTLGGLTLGKTGNTANITIGSAVSTTGPINVYGGNIIVNAALSAGGGAISLNASGTGAIASNATGTISNFSALTLNTSNAAGSGTLAGNISGTGSVTKSGAGRVILSGTNSYNGNTNISAGTLQAGSTSGFSSGSVFSVSTGTTLDIAGFNATTGALSGSGTVSNSSTSAGTFTTGGLNSSTSFSGVIQNGTGVVALTKAGSGTLTLSGANSYTGTTTINAGTLSLAGSLNLGSAGANAVIASGATLMGAGVLTANSLNVNGAGTVNLTGANMLNSASASGTIGAFTLNNAKSIALGSIASTGPTIVTATGASSDLTLSPGAVISSVASGDAVILAAGRNFINNSGAGAVSTSNGRWLIYSAAPGGDVFGSLNSGNTAIWNSSYTGAAVNQGGNRYLFVAQPTLTVTRTSLSKIYGDDAGSAVGAAYTITGYHAGVAGAFLGDNAASALSGAISFGSAGSASTANVGSHGITITNNTLVAHNGYTLAVATAGTLTVNARTVTLSAGKVYDGTTGLSGVVTLGNLANGDTLTYNGATANSAHVAANGTNYISAIVLGDGTGLASNYVLPTLNAANAAVSITPASLTAVAGITGPLSRAYNGTTSTTASVSGVISGAVAGDSISFDAGGISLGYNSAHVATATSISASGSGGFTITGSTSGSQASDYSFTAPVIASVAATITPAHITASLGNSLVSKVYDGTDDVPSGFVPNWIVAGGISGDTLTLDHGAAAYDSKDVGSASRVTVSGLSLAGASTGAGSQLSDYVLDTLSADIAAYITPATLAITGLAAAGKVYDGTVAANVTDWGSLSGLIGSETLTLLRGSAAFASADAGAGKTVTATGYNLGNGANGGLASNYQLGATSATTSASIDKAVLTVIANNDAKFITKSDNAGYAGVSYTGFVNGETSVVISGNATVSRSNDGMHVAGYYDGVLLADASGLSAANYSFTTQNGDYTIVPSNQLLIRASNSSAIYGDTADFTIGSAEYFDGSNVIALGAATKNQDGSFTVQDGAGGSATFTVGIANAVLSGAGFTAVGAYQLDAANVTTQNALNFSNMLNLVGALSVTPKQVTANIASGISKVYDGTNAMNGAIMDLGGVVTGDRVTVSGDGAFGSINAGRNIRYTISNLELGGADAGNYYTGSTSFSGNDGAITQRQLIVTANDANRAYGAADPTFAYAIGGGGLVAGDALSGGLSTNASGLSNVGSYNIDQGSLAASTNYAISYVGATLTINQREVAMWVGGNTGNWFDPANWADGAVPTLSNVGNVLIPTGVTVTFDTAGALAGIPTGPVNLSGLGQGGSLLVNDGALNVGSGGISLADLTQTGGAISSTGDVTLGSFAQTGGATSVQGDFTTTTGFTQSGSGALAIGGDAAIGATNGGVTLGNLAVGGALEVDSKDGPITQGAGTHLAVEGAGSYTATKNGQPADIALTNAGNDLGSKVSVDGANVALVQESALALDIAKTTGNLDVKAGGSIAFGETNVGGNLHATTPQGGISQTGPVAVAGSTSLSAGTGDIAMGNGANSFGGPVAMSGAGVTLSASGPVVLGNVDATGKLNVSSGTGRITQSPGTQRNAAGGMSLGGSTGEERSLTPFVVPERLLSGATTAAATKQAELPGAKDGAAGSCDPVAASNIYRANGGLANGAAGCSAQ